MTYRALMHHVTTVYLDESTQRMDAAERAAQARRLVANGVDAETLESYYTDPYMELAAAFVEGTDHSWQRLTEMVNERFGPQVSNQNQGRDEQ